MGEDGKWIGGTHGGSSNFSFALLLKDSILLPGKYTILVDPTWDESTSLHPDFKDVLIDIYCPLNLEIQLVDKQQGDRCLVNCLKYVA